MQDLIRPNDRPFFFPRWAMISISSFILLAAVVQMWKNFARLDWVTTLSFGLYFLVYWPRKKDEPLGEYIRQPRGVLTSALLVVIIGSALRSLYLVSQN